MIKPKCFFFKDSLDIRIYTDRETMGTAAAIDGGELLRNLLATQEIVRVIFAAAPSQNEFLKQLCNAPDIDWNRVHAFHMDEYINLQKDAPQGFANFLHKNIFDILPFGKINLLNGNSEDINAECERYEKLLSKAPIDIVFMGIGENGHIAFNDPPVADFNDKQAVKVVVLDNVCRNQQVNDGCFENIDLVPTHALTLTIPTLMTASYHLCIVPARTKAQAVYNTVNGKISTQCPASILRDCKNAVLYLDCESAMLLN